MLTNKIKEYFVNVEFIKFILIGIVNSFNGIWIAYVYSLFFESSIIAYILGFLTSLSISYILNSFLNFKEKLSTIKFIKFTINNIPNFIIQVSSVVILIQILQVSKIISYAISSVISVPITFILLKINVFNPKKGK